MYQSGQRCYVIAGWLSIGCQVGRTACVCPMARLWFCDLPIVGWFPAGMVISRMPKRNSLHGARCRCLGSQQCSSCYIFISPYLVSRVSHTLYNASRSLIRSLQYLIVGHRSRPSFHTNARCFAIALATKPALGNIASSNDCEIIFSWRLSLPWALLSRGSCTSLLSSYSACSSPHRHAYAHVHA